MSLYRAAVRTGRQLVIDPYAAATLAACDRAAIPKATWRGCRVFVPLSQRAAIRRGGREAALRAVGGQRVGPAELRRTPERFLMLARASMCRELDRFVEPRHARLVWSMWPGYLERSGGDGLARWAQERGIALEVLHASGHASPAALRQLVRGMSPRRVVPIHTSRPDLFRSLTEVLTPQPNGIWWTA